MKEEKAIKLDYTKYLEIINNINDGNEIDMHFKDNSLYEEFIEKYNLLLNSNNSTSKIKHKNYDSGISKILLILKQIDSKTNKINCFLNNITKNIVNKYSLINIYNLFDKSEINFHDNIDIITNILDSKLSIFDDFLWLEEFIYNQDTLPKATIFSKYMKCINSKRFNNLKEKINEDTLEKSILKLDSLLNNKYSLKAPIYLNKYTDDFIALSNPCEIEDVDLENYVKALNLKYNYNIILNQEKLKWYYYIIPLKIKKIKEYNISIERAYNEQELSILKEFKENIEFIKIFINSFNFLEEILNDKPLKKIEALIYDEDQLFEYLNSVKENLIILKEFKVLFNEVNDYELREIEVFDYCYNNSNSIIEFENIIMLLPKLLLYITLINFEENHEEDIIDISKEIYTLYDYIVILKNTFEEYKVDFSKYFKNYNCKDNGEECAYIIEEVKSDIILDIINYKNINKNIKWDKNLCTNILKNRNIKEFISFIKSFGYDFVYNYPYKDLILDVVIKKIDSTDSIIYINFDFMINDNIEYIQKLLYLIDNKVNIIFYDSRSFWQNKLEAYNNIKHQLTRFK